MRQFRAGAPHSERRRTNRGSAAVEFALVLPMLLMLAFGTIDYGYLINRTTMLNNAAREGARIAMFDPDVVAIESRIRSVIPTLDQGRVTVTITCTKPDQTPCPAGPLENEWEEGGSVIVVVRYLHDYLTPAPSILGMGASRNLSATVSMRIEG